MINGKSNKTSKPIQIKSPSKNKINNVISDQTIAKNKIRSNSKNQFIVANNNNINNNKINSNDYNKFEDFNNMNINNKVLDIKKLDNFPSRPPTQQLLNRNPSPFESAYNRTDNKFFKINNFKIGDFINDKKENNLNKFNKKANTKFVNDLIPFNDVYKKNKQINNPNSNAKSLKSGKFRGNASDMSNMLANQNDYEIFDFKKKVI